MNVLRCAVLAVLLFLPLAGRASAQWSPDLRAGTRVRLLLPESEFQLRGPRGQLVRGTIARLAPDTLYLRLGDSVGTVAVPRALVRRLDLSKGVPSRMASAARTGVVWGVLLGIWMALYPEQQPNSLSDTEQAAIGAGVGLTVGAVFGAIYPVERWKRLRLEPGIARTSMGDVSLGVRLAW